MRAVIQRVAEAAVSVAGREVARIGPGLLVLVGVREGDRDQDARYLAGKIAGLRIFADAEGKMNLSVIDAGGSVLLVSQFTLYGDCRKGRRPSFVNAAAPVEAERLYALVAEELAARDVPTDTGIFREHMQVSLVNDGPVTILIDSEKQI